MPRDLGDFQTPIPLAEQIISLLVSQGKRWSRILEPTCGQGNFVIAALSMPSLSNTTIQGIEIQTSHIAVANQRLGSVRDHVHLTHASIFDINLKTDITWDTAGALLVVGNPPWVTNAELGALNSENLPPKENLKKLSGLDALTGGSNFDITEAIWLKLIRELEDEEPTIALLCKTSVARNVLTFAAQTALPIQRAALWRIDAKKWFNVAVDACLFYVEVGQGAHDYSAPVYASLLGTKPETTMRFSENKLVADYARYTQYQFMDGVSSVEWRQGVKHDAAPVMELRELNGSWINKLDEVVELEADYVYPLLKSSDVFHGRLFPQSKYVIVTQSALGEETAHLAQDAPKLWNYLNCHAGIFHKRKSSIYANRPAFSMFGIGDYSFAPYKVAISGLYKEPTFRLVVPVESQPVMLDDTCYFIPCADLPQAALLIGLLSHPNTINFIHSIVFSDSKRPITKKLLQRININALLDQIGAAEVIRHAEEVLSSLKQPIQVEDIQWEQTIDQFLSTVITSA